MLAFSLLELGRMADAEEAARKGYEINKQDYWAQHAVGSHHLSMMQYMISCLFMFFPP
jgi:hypothetical protein